MTWLKYIEVKEKAISEFLEKMLSIQRSVLFMEKRCQKNIYYSRPMKIGMREIRDLKSKSGSTE